MIIADTDFLSSFVKIKRVDLILKAFKTEKITIPIAVLRELERAPVINEVINLIDTKKVEVVNTEREEVSDEFGVGEVECMALAERMKGILLTSDLSAVKNAGRRGITVVDIPTFLLHCKQTKRLTKEEIKEIIKDLKEKDYYEFSDGVKKTLMQ